MMGKKLSFRKEIVGLLAILLLSGLFAGSAYAVVNGGDCAACHAGRVGSYPKILNNMYGSHHGVRDRVNAGIDAWNPNYMPCSECHTAIGWFPPFNYGCTDCHQATKHVSAHDQGQSPPVDCQVCHSLNMVSEHVNRTNLNKCLTCHDGSLPNGKASADGTTIPAATTTAAINKGWSLNQPVNCTDCHGSDAGNHTAAHDPVPPAGCTDCHAVNLVVEHKKHYAEDKVCNTCHDNQRTDATAKQMVIDAIAAGMIDGTSVDCYSCHAEHHVGAHTRTPLSTDCQACHNPELATLHFAYEQFWTDLCLTCHDNSPYKEVTQIEGEVSCADCHGSGAGNHVAEHDKVVPCAGCHDANVVVEHVDNKNHSCATCHDNQRTDPVAKQKVIDAIAKGRGDAGLPVNCSDCHLGHNSSSHISDLDALCASCHYANVLNEHLGRPIFQQASCNVCHNSMDSFVVATIKKGKLANDAKQDPVYGCADCHVGEFAGGGHEAAHGPVPTNSTCVSCHPGAANVVTLHVTKMGLSCSTCHSSADTSVKAAITNGSSPNNGALISCGSCHNNPGEHLTGHLRIVKPAGCEACHAGKLPILHFRSNCQTCHNNATYDTVIDSTGDVGCSACHGAGAGDHATVHANTNVPAEGCATCHNRDVYVEHVTAIDPITGVKRNVACASCHGGLYDDVISKPGVVVCSDCHIGSAGGHHAGTDAQTGKCTVCHQVPAWAMDAPKQAACRQCHGANKHGKGGPIQDFGACFACHNPQPYHAKPTRAPGWYKEFSSAPGRGTFNIFYSEFKPSSRDTGEGSPRERWSGYGEKGNPSRYKDSQWRNASVSFNWATISHNGYTYNVPAFSSISGGGTTPPPATADTVNITKAEYSDSKITVYATNSLKNQAQLTAKYCSNNYPMTWKSDSSRWELSKDHVSYCSSVTVTSSKGGSATSSVIKR